MKTTLEERTIEPDSRRASGDINVPRIPKSLRGRAVKYTPVKLRNRINDYFALCDKKNLVPTVSGIYGHLKINKATWYVYCDRPELSAICEWARDAIEQWFIQGLWDSSSSNTNKQLVAKQNCGWQEQTVHTTRIISIDEAQAKLERFLPLLLEMHKKSLDKQAQIEYVEGEVVNG